MCVPTAEDAAFDKLVANAQKSCTEELRGMPDTEFKKTTMRECVCRVKGSAGKPCLEVSEEERREAADREFEEGCQAHVEAHGTGAKSRDAVQDCVCRKVGGAGGCGDRDALDSQIDGFVNNCKKESNRRGLSASNKKKAARNCVCKARAGTSAPCLDATDRSGLLEKISAARAACSAPDKTEL